MFEDKINNSSESSIKTENSSDPKPVFVRVNQGGNPSPHIVNLKEEDSKKETLDGVEAFREQMGEVTERKELDFADIIREANRKYPHKEESIRIKHENAKAIKNSELNSIFEKRKQKNKESIVKSSIKQEKKESKRKEKTTSFNQKETVLTKISNVGKLTVKQISETTTSAISGLFSGFSSVLDMFGSSIQFLSGKRFAMGVIALVLVTMLPFPVIGYYNKVKQDSKYIISKSTSGFTSLKSSTEAVFSSNINKAQYDLSNALSSFNQAQTLLKKEHKAAMYIASMLPVVGSKVTARQNLLTAGHHFALGNTYLVKGISDAKNNSDSSVIERLELLKSHLQSAIPQYEEALRSIAGVSNDAIPEEYQGSAEEFKLLFAAMINDMKDLVSLIDAASLVFGQDGYKKYLVIFQNNHELRATGGFAGSFAVVDVKNGEIEWNIPEGGTYDLQGQMNLPLKPPVPIQTVNKKWEFQDSNWYSHLPASAHLMERMYEEARGDSVDGVITINATVLKRLLRVVGPIQSEKIEGGLNSENVLTKLQYKVEKGYENKRAPKAVLTTLSKQIMKRMENIEKLDVLKLAAEGHKALEKKEIQVYMDDKHAQDTFRSFGWTGEVLSPNEKQDYLHLVRSNLQGQKSDAKIKENMVLDTRIKQDGSVINTLSITRKHTGSPGEEFYGADNISHIRAYVPEGAKLLSAKGFEYPPEKLFKVPNKEYEDHPLVKKKKEVATTDLESGTKISKQFDKTVFSNWIITEPGNKSRAVLKYELPFKIKEQKKKEIKNTKKWKQLFLGKDKKRKVLPYSMLLQKQSGTDYNYLHRIHIQGEWVPVWSSTDKINFTESAAEYDTSLNSDMKYGVLIEQK